MLDDWVLLLERISALTLENHWASSHCRRIVKCVLGGSDFWLLVRIDTLLQLAASVHEWVYVILSKIIEIRVHLLRLRWLQPWLRSCEEGVWLGDHRRLAISHWYLLNWLLIRKRVFDIRLLLGLRVSLKPIPITKVSQQSLPVACLPKHHPESCILVS